MKFVTNKRISRTFPSSRLPKEMLDLAAHIVQTKSGHFDPAQFEDRYENALIDLLKKKEAGEKIQPAKEGPTPQVVNLMDARRASIDAEKRKRRRRARKRGDLLSGEPARSDPFRHPK